jgi:AraC-like DNA-binding protein
MDTVPENGAVEDEQFSIPRDFLVRFEERSQAQALIVTDIGCYPKAIYHFCSRPKGSETAILLYCTEGSGSYTLRGGEFHTLNPGQFILIPPNTPHIYEAVRENPWTIFWIHLKGSLFYAFYDMVSAAMPALIPEYYGVQLTGLFRQCFTILKRPYGDEEFLYLCQLAAAMLALLPCAVKQSAVRLSVNGVQGVERAIAFMKENIHKIITLEDLAQAAQFSSSHLHYLFKQFAGCAPVEYFLREKIQAAAKDLYFSTRSVKHIAETYGIEDPYYFSRLFKKIIGITPTQYRKGVKG